MCADAVGVWSLVAAKNSCGCVRVAGCGLSVGGPPRTSVFEERARSVTSVHPPSQPHGLSGSSSHNHPSGPLPHSLSPSPASRPRRAAIGGYHAARTGAGGAARPSSRAFLQRKITWVLHVHSTDIKCEPARLAPEPRGAPRSTTLCSRLPRASRVIRAATAAPRAPG